MFFRQSAAAEAVKLKLAGFVRNEPDGSVYLEVEGDKEATDKFLKWCRHGPPFARVDKVEISCSPLKHFPGFEMN